MRKILLVACFALTACAKHAGESIAITKNGPQAPINQPDTSIQPPSNSNNSDPQAPIGGNGQPGGSGSGSGSGEPGGSGSGGSGSGSNSGGTGNANSGSGTSGPIGPEPGGPGNGGPAGGPSQPVPEPGTLLLVGTGLAGIALLRRRREARPE